jgi:hypothetical protein
VKAVDAWENLSTWLEGYSGYVRAKSLRGAADYFFIRDRMYFDFIDVIELRFPGVDALDLLGTRVQLDQFLPLTSAEISSVVDFDKLPNSPEFCARVAEWRAALPEKDNVVRLPETHPATINFWKSLFELSQEMEDAWKKSKCEE